MQGNHVGLVCERIVVFPVEHHPLENPDLVLIVRSARELVMLADAAGYAEVVLAWPGFGRSVGIAGRLGHVGADRGEARGRGDDSPGC